MKHLVFTVMILVMFATSAMAATNTTEYTNAPFTDDSIEVLSEVFISVGSLTVTRDTVGSTLYLISGSVELGAQAHVLIGLCSDTSSTGALELISYDGDSTSNDTTTATTHEWYWRENIGDSKMRIPFAFQQEFNTDSVDGGQQLLLKCKIGGAHKTTQLHDVRIEAIVNMTDQP